MSDEEQIDLEGIAFGFAQRLIPLRRQRECTGCGFTYSLVDLTMHEYHLDARCHMPPASNAEVG